MGILAPLRLEYGGQGVLGRAVVKGMNRELRRKQGGSAWAQG
jgi:hypothetical protein